jgi:diphthamide synthase (EF-2-diphthine--ammonia ligase)
VVPPCNEFTEGESIETLEEIRAMMVSKPRILLCWSSGKDSAWALHVLRQQPDLEVVGLLTTFNEAFDRVAMHAVRRNLVEAQAAAAGLPLVPVMLPYPCSNEIYEERMKAAVAEAKSKGVTHMAFGDLFLQDIKEYRIRLLESTGVTPMFPIWTTKEDTPSLARQMLDAGLRAVLTCVDPKQLDTRFVGREFDADFLAELPAGNGVSFTPSVTGALSLSQKSPSASAMSLSEKGSGLPMSKPMSNAANRGRLTRA